MQETNTSIALESLKVLESLSERLWAAYPASLLPYPKETIRQAILEYVKAEGMKFSVVEMELIVYRYALLAYFLNEEDAALVNAMAIRCGAGNMMQRKDLLTTIDLPEHLIGTNFPSRNLELNNQIESESTALRQELRSLYEEVAAIRA